MKSDSLRAQVARYFASQGVRADSEDIAAVEMNLMMMGVTDYTPLSVDTIEECIQRSGLTELLQYRYPEWEMMGSVPNF